MIFQFFMNVYFKFCKKWHICSLNAHVAFPIDIGMVAESTQIFLKFYIGSSLDLSERLENHKNKLYTNCYTAKDNSWELFFEIPNLEYQQAREIENHIKKMKDIYS